MEDAFKLTADLREALIGKTISGVDVDDGQPFGTSFTLLFSDGTSAYLETDGYDGIGITIEPGQ
jgi:hypothetical protein